MDGMELATKPAKADADVEVQLSVVHSLMFRRGIRLASGILRTGPDTLWERVAQDRWGTHFLHKDIADRIRQLQIGLTMKETNKPRLLSLLVEPKDDAPVQADVERAVYELIADPAFPVQGRSVAVVPWRRHAAGRRADRCRPHPRNGPF
jgi:hypothetical protein